MKRCSQGHYYDATKYSRCPACGIPDLAVQATQGHAIAETPLNLDKIDKTQAFGSPARAGAVRRVDKRSASTTANTQVRA